MRRGSRRWLVVVAAVLTAASLGGTAHAGHSAPSDLFIQVDRRGADQVVFQWTAPMGATSQRIRYLQGTCSLADPGTNGNVLVTVSGTASTHTYSGHLTQNYCWAVEATHDAGGSFGANTTVSEEIETAVVTTDETYQWFPAEPGPAPSTEPPAAPEITSVVMSEDSGAVTWTTPPDSTTYKVWARRSSASQWGTAVEMADPNNTHTFQGLTPGRSYDFRAAACNEIGCTNSEIVSASTSVGTGDSWSAEDSDNLLKIREQSRLSHLTFTTAFGFVLFALAGLLVFSFWRGVK